MKKELRKNLERFPLKPGTMIQQYQRKMDVIDAARELIRVTQPQNIRAKDRRVMDAWQHLCFCLAVLCDDFDFVVSPENLDA